MFQKVMYAENWLVESSFLAHTVSFIYPYKLPDPKITHVISPIIHIATN